MRLWRRVQYWRAMRIYARAVRLAVKARWLTRKADRLIGKNVRPPMPLFDRYQEGKGK
jgi:hypothetical protein